MNDAWVRSSKAHAYITRCLEEVVELLVLAHRHNPDAGLQVPGGTLKSGETAIEALHRELFEESGLTALELMRPLGMRVLPSPIHGDPLRYHAFHLVGQSELPDAWVHTVSAGEGDLGLAFEYFWLSLPEVAQALIEVLRAPAEELAGQFQVA